MDEEGRKGRGEDEMGGLTGGVREAAVGRRGGTTSLRAGWCYQRGKAWTREGRKGRGEDEMGGLTGGVREATVGRRGGTTSLRAG
jgi:hypothetical protein